jgi:ABC-type antimicrobial peptide transport system permease subunit
LLVRSPEAPDRLAREIQAALATLDPHLQGFFTRTLIQHVGVSLLPVRLAAGTATAVAALALGLALLGLYSLVSYLVAERTHEIGLRMALGANATDVMRLLLAHGVKLAIVGLTLGIPTALASSRLLGNLLYGVSAADPLVFAIASVTVLAVATVASYVPARRGSRSIRSRR